jgi:hypothetical protein
MVSKGLNLFKVLIILGIGLICYVKINLNFLKVYDASGQKISQDADANSLCVVANYFNPMQFKKNYENYRKFEKHMASFDVPMITVELVFDNRTFQVTSENNSNHIQLRTNDILWYKENLINIGIKKSPKTCKYIAWIDLEIEFSNKNWVEHTKKALEEFDVVQVFEVANVLGPNRTIIEQFVSYGLCNQKMKFGLNYSDFEAMYDVKLIPFCHSGYGWAAKKSFLMNIGGLFDKDIVGDSDYIMAKAFSAELYQLEEWYKTKNQYYLKEVRDWQINVVNNMNGSVGFVKGQINHTYHGSPDNRGYDVRKGILHSELVPFKPLEHIFYDKNGLIHYTPKLRGYFMTVIGAYFQRRLDDD